MPSKKNSRNKKKTRGGGKKPGEVNTATTNKATDLNVNTATNMVAPDLIDEHGRMPEKQGIYLQKLLAVVRSIAVPKLNEERKLAGLEPINWNLDNVLENNSPESMDLVLHHALREIDWVIDQVEKRARSELVKSIMGRRLTETDLKTIRSWKMHIIDDFFVVGHIPNVGSILVQVGRLQHREGLKDTIPGASHSDYHEPRVFVVQGVCTPLKQLTKPMCEDFMAENPSSLKSYPKLADSLCCIHTRLLPFNNGITYAGTISPQRHGHYSTKEDLALAVYRAVDTFHGSFTVGGTPNQSDISVYFSLDSDRDLAICRLASSPFFSPQHSIQHQRREPLENETQLIMEQEYWVPLPNPNDPRCKDLVVKATTPKEEPFICDGFLITTKEFRNLRDEVPCPFHLSLRGTHSFLDCCKSKHLGRVKKAKQRNLDHKARVLYNPVSMEDVLLLDEYGSIADELRTPNRMILRVGRQDLGIIQLKVPQEAVPIVKERLSCIEQFHNIHEYKWLFWGMIPVKVPQSGVMIFGNVHMIPNEGLVVGEASTSGRIKGLIEALKKVCSVPGFPIIDAVLEMRPSYKNKHDKVAFQENIEHFQYEFDDCIVRSVVNDKVNAGLGLFCSYCGIDEEELGRTMQFCACKAACYCSEAHQKLHRIDHKNECKYSKEER